MWGAWRCGAQAVSSSESERGERRPQSARVLAAPLSVGAELRSKRLCLRLRVRLNVILGVSRRVAALECLEAMGTRLDAWHRCRDNATLVARRRRWRWPVSGRQLPIRSIEPRRRQRVGCVREIVRFIAYPTGHATIVPGAHVCRSLGSGERPRDRESDGTGERVVRPERVPLRKAVLRRHAEETIERQCHLDQKIVVVVVLPHLERGGTGA